MFVMTYASLDTEPASLFQIWHFWLRESWNRSGVILITLLCFQYWLYGWLIQG